jgi:glyoxylase-like metal-dependent hydrolase (beta-lactamase superfamily II)
VNDRLYFRQLLSGRDFARNDRAAHQMVNFVYVIGDRVTGEAVIVDPAYDVAELSDIVANDGLRLTGALVTHYHPDHVGGDFMGIHVQGIQELLALPGGGVPVHVNDNEAWGVKRVTGCSDNDMVQHQAGDTIMVGEIPITCLHTPGHTPGSQCFLLSTGDESRLISGDTLFLEGCGRVDLPGASPEQMYDSLNNVLGKLDGDTTVFPGHLYSQDPSASLDSIRSSNYVYRFKTLEQFMIMFGSN